VRYNDFIGSDEHRWNDAIEGHGNGKVDGGFYRDASIYGNMLAFGNDDGIELDGGQMNVRFFQNKIEGFFCGVSTAPCLLGPSYIFRNLIVNLGDEQNLTNFTFKNIYKTDGSGQLFFFNNTVLVQAAGFSPYSSRKSVPAGLQKGMSRNNLLHCAANHIYPNLFKWENDFDHDLFYSTKPDQVDQEGLHALHAEKHAIFGQDPVFRNIATADFRLDPSSPALGSGAFIPGFSAPGKPTDIGAYDLDPDMTLPYRPIPVRLDKNQLNFTRPGQSETIRVSITGKDLDTGFRVMKNQTSDWLKVTPQSGRFVSGMRTDFTVTLDPSKVSPGDNKAVFLIRLDNGFSRPVTVYARMAPPPTRIKLNGAHVYLEAERPSDSTAFATVADPNASEASLYFEADGSRKLGNQVAEYTFNIPEDGNYAILMRVKGEHPIGNHDSIFMAVNSEPFSYASLRCSTDWTWSIAANKKKQNFNAYFLKKGMNRLRLSPRESIWVDQILLAVEPWPLFKKNNK
jgi:hypothetical protein